MKNTRLARFLGICTALMLYSPSFATDFALNPARDFGAIRRINPTDYNGYAVVRENGAGLSSGTAAAFRAALEVFSKAEAEPAGAVATHAGLTATHGATGAVVGTTNTQALTNKTLTDASNHISGSVIDSGTVADANIASTIARDSELAASMSAANASDALNLRLDGSRAMKGNLKLNGKWLSNDGDSEGVYVSSTGYVGIGTSTPSELLVVTGTNVKPIIGKNSHTELYPGYNMQNITGLEIHAGNTGTNLANIIISNALTSSYCGAIVFATTGTAGSEKRYAMMAGIPESDSSVTVNGALQFSTTKDGALSEVARMTKQKNLLIGTTTDDGTNKLQVNGPVYVASYVSALGYIDRTEAPDTLAEAYAIVQSHEVTAAGELDHTKLHPAAWGKRVELQPTGRTITRIVQEPIKDAESLEEGKVPTEEKTVEEPEMMQIVVPDQSGRDLSMVISAQALVIKDLTKRIEALESQ